MHNGCIVNLHLSKKCVYVTRSMLESAASSGDKWSYDILYLKCSNSFSWPWKVKMLWSHQGLGTLALSILHLVDSLWWKKHVPWACPLSNKTPRLSTCNLVTIPAALHRLHYSSCTALKQRSNTSCLYIWEKGHYKCAYYVLLNAILFTKLLFLNWTQLEWRSRLAIAVKPMVTRFS